MNKFRLFAFIVSIVFISCSNDNGISNPKNIMDALNTSKENYNSALDNSWIEITKNEYLLLTKLSNVTKAGISEKFYKNDLSVLKSGAYGYTIAGYGTNITKIPKNSYVFAFKYVCNTDDDRITDQVKFSINQNPTLDYKNLGSRLPLHSGKGEHFFILKNNTNKISNEGFLGFYSSNKIGWYNIEGISNAYVAGNKNTIDGGVESQNYQYQALSTTIKQW